MEFFGETLKQCGYDPSLTTLSQSPDSATGAPIDWFLVETQGAVQINFPSLLNSVTLIRNVPEIKELLSDDTEGGALSAERCGCLLQSMGLALNTLCYNAAYKTSTKFDLFKAVDCNSTIQDSRIPSYIAGRIINHSPVTPLRRLRAHHLGRFISIKGIVVRVGPVEPVCRRLSFECTQCGTRQVLILPTGGRFSTPTRCTFRGCRSRCFEPLLNHPDTVTVDTQIITVQEASEPQPDRLLGEVSTSASSLGRSPRCLPCRLTLDLADSCIPGDVVHLAGVVSLLNTDSQASSSAHASWSSRRSGNMFSLLLEVNGLTKMSGGSNINFRRMAGSSNYLSGNSGMLLITSGDEFGNPELANGERSIEQSNTHSDSDFSIKDLYAIREISEQPNLFRLLVASLCPSICGRALVKAGLLLALFGGTQNPRPNKRRQKRLRNPTERTLTDDCAEDNIFESDSDDAGTSYRLGANQLVSPKVVTGNGSPDLSSSSDEIKEDDYQQENSTSDWSDGVTETTARRSASHVLIVGDPGLGKSQMLRAAASLSPRVIYVSGNTVSAAGLTVSTIREGSGSGGGFALEAGALVLADQGCCCIDEFDKLACDPAVLLEAMEQQTISVARGGLVANLPARAAVLASANPVGGHYDSTRRLDENLRISPALLSRFDLVFVLLDRPDELADRLLSEHVTALHTGDWKPSSFTCTQSSPFGLQQSTRSQPTTIYVDPTASLEDRLELRLGEQIDYIPPVLLRKYILYARKYVMPSLSSEAALTLRDFYLELRRNRHAPDAFPVTLRQLESLVRLTEARARADLREEATREDALDACELMRATGVGTGMVCGTPANATLSQIAKMIPTTSRRSTSDSGPAASKRLLAALEIASQRSNSRIFTIEDVRAICAGLGISLTNLDILLSRLNEAGAVLKQSSDVYKLV
ncbi:unnamed protein product [Dicrocoelium dendriticum]|nr:unnamed protein product [Dicrocoelium dendriticum]